MIGDIQVFLKPTDGAPESNNLSKSPAGSGVRLETVPRKLSSQFLHTQGCPSRLQCPSGNHPHMLQIR